MSKLKKFVILPLGLALIVVVVSYFVFIKPYQTPPPPVMGKVLDFELIDSNNSAFQKKSLDNKVWVADFIFTSCGGVCPRMSAKMAEVYRSYDMETDVHFVSISVDPDTDTPERLQEYAKRYNAKSDQWHFLTGKYDDIRDIAVNSFKVGKIDEPIFHSQRFILVDQNSNIRGYYEYNDKESMKKLFHDIALVLQEKNV